jgi:hypothetical protein
MAWRRIIKNPVVGSQHLRAVERPTAPAALRGFAFRESGKSETFRAHKLARRIATA